MVFTKMVLAPAAAMALGVTLFGVGGSGSDGPGSATSFTLRIPNEAAPAGGMVQMKVMTTEVTPISGGRPGFGFDAFEAAAGFSISAPNGEVAGAAVLDGHHVQISYDGTSMLTANYPILTTVLKVPANVAPGSRLQFSMDPGSLWNYSNSGPVATKPVPPATVTVVGSTGVSIDDVVPGEGVWPAGTVISVRGSGFSSKTSLRVNDAGVKNWRVAGPREIQFVLPAPMEVRGLRITVQGQVNAVTYYAYMRGIDAAVSSRTLLAMTEAIFSVVPRTSATFGPFTELAGNQYVAVALQNPTAGDVAVQVSLTTYDGTPLYQTELMLESRHRLAMEGSELLDGIVPPAGTMIVITASAPIDVIGLLCDEGAGTVTPSLPLESRP